MKKILLILLVTASLLALSACSNESETITPSPPPSEISSGTDNHETLTPSESPEGEISDSIETEDSEGKILVAYFSSAGNIVVDEEVKGNIGKGNTRGLAEMIEEQVGGDLFFIETDNKYPANYNDAIAAAMQDLRDDARPALSSHVENMDEYDVIFLGYPNWWGTVPQAVLTFLEEYDFTDKTVVPFCTYEDSGIGRSVQDIEKILPNSAILENFSVAERDLEKEETVESVKQWILELNLDN